MPRHSISHLSSLPFFLVSSPITTDYNRGYGGYGNGYGSNYNRGYGGYGNDSYYRSGGYGGYGGYGRRMGGM